ncbi:MAG: peptidoglycan bridge formation glycyltransferase FemA/FemB family protein [Erysipelotrichaceae bacterium]|nr:peptidoglycan bridge formation glycyltransferase FemA/FemB family protein [Erysipelotrichaceae bacterium]
MYKFYIDTNKEAFDAFVQEHAYASLLQGSKWSLIKDNWGHQFVSVTKEDTIVATAMILIKHMPLGFTLFYIPRGPVMDYENEELVRFFFVELKKYAKTQKAICVKFDPLVIYNAFALKDVENRKTYDHKTVELLKSMGVHHYGYNLDMHDATQPRTQAVFYFYENWRNDYSSNLKKNVQKAKNKGVQWKQAGKESIDIFADLLKKTSDRQGVALRDKSYFERLMDVYQEDAAIFLTYINQKKLLLEATNKLNDIQQNLQANPNRAASKLKAIYENIQGLEDEIARLQQNIEVDGEIAYISATLICKDKHTSELLYAGMDDKYNKYCGTYISWLKALEWAEDAGCRKCNFGGVQGTLDDGLTSYKSRFSPVFEDYIGELDMPVMPLWYRMFVVTLPMAKKVLRGIRSWKK